MSDAATKHPDWNHLFEVAASQEGFFTTQQAADAGYSPQLLIHYLHAGYVRRVRRGIYRLVHFPAGEHEELVAAWLWSEREGVFSHQTALALHGLSDILPSHIHMTLPSEWKRRRLRTPENVVLHFQDISSLERSWFGSAPASDPARTLNDCALANLSPDLLEQAANQALRRGLVTRQSLDEVNRSLAQFRRTAR